MNKSEAIKKILAFGIYIIFAMLFWPFLTPLLFAVLFAFALNPVLKKVRSRYPKVKSHKTLVAGSLAAILSIFCIPISVLIFTAITQIKKIETGDLAALPIYKNFQSVIQIVNTWLQSISAQFNIDISAYIDLNAIFTKTTQIIIPLVTSVVTQLPTFLFQFLIFMVALYLILTNTAFFKLWFHRLNLFSEAQLSQLSALIQKICNLVLISTVIVATAQATVISLACLMAGYTDFIIVFMITFFLSFIPVIGSAPISIALIIYSLMNAQFTSGVIIIIAAIIAASIDNIIKTYMLTGEGTSGVHPFVSLLALIGSFGLFGFAGLFLGPIICELAFQIGAILVSTTDSEVA